MGKAKNPLSILRRAMLKRQASLAGHRPVDEARACPADSIESLEGRLRLIIDVLDSGDCVKPGNMLFFVMYDISANKVRTAVAKYLLRKGCHRIQRSIFMGNAPVAVCRDIERDLHEVQAMYDNDDSIFVVPLSVEQVRIMRVIGRDVDLDLIVNAKSTAFF